MFRSIYIALLVAGAVSAAPTTPDIPRFQKVADGFYRGGQPEKEGFEYLKSQGIRTIINLRTENDEEGTVHRLGMNYVHLPMEVTPKSKIPEQAIHHYFQVLSNPDNYPIFIHCKRGADRTGAMVGFYRIAVQDWAAEKAYKEARDIGMRWWYPGLKAQLYNFKNPENASLLKSLPAMMLPIQR